MTQPKNRPFSIRIFLPDGTSDGLRIIEKSNWSGRGLVCPRPLLPSARSRPDFGKAGVYVLAGPPESGGLPKVYIGEGSPVGARLEQHFARRDFWTTATFFTSKDENLNKAHIQYLEARLIGLAKDAKRCDLENATAPDLPALSEMDAADVEGFLDEMLLCLPVLGVTVFEKPAAVAPPAAQVLLLKGKDAEGKGYEAAQGFVVLAGARARADEVPSIDNYVSQRRKSLLGLGVLKPDGTALLLAQDYTFDSPSTAAAVLLGRTANGRIEWKDGQGHTLKEIQAGEAGGAST